MIINIMLPLNRQSVFRGLHFNICMKTIDAFTKSQLWKYGNNCDNDYMIYDDNYNFGKYRALEDFKYMLDDLFKFVETYLIKE